MSTAPRRTTMTVGLDGLRRNQAVAPPIAAAIVDGSRPELIGDRRVIERIPGGGWAYVFVDEGVRVEARYLRADHGQLYGEVDVRADWAGATRHKGSLSCAYQNLHSLTARRALAKHCAARAKTPPDAYDWPAAIESACIEIISAARQGADRPIVLDDAPDVVERDHEVYGLRVPADATSMLIAHGDSLKSMLTLLVLGTLAQRGHAVLYLDWEWSADRHRRRKQRLFGPDRLERFHYMRCQAPLVTEADRIRRYCDEQAITFVAVDSVGMACDGPLKDDEVAVRFHRALASIRPALCAAHVPKSTLGADAKPDVVTPFGSVFFNNLARMTWSVKKQPGATEDIVTVGCFPSKQNDGQRIKPTGIEFTFTGDRIDSISVRAVDLATVEGLAERLPMAARMAAVLRAGPQTIAQIADALDAKPDTVEKTLRRGMGTRFIRIEGTTAGSVFHWALLDRRSA